MSGRDVAARLGDGESAVAELQRVFTAVASGAAIGDRYGAEQGLDLRLLDEEAAVLRMIAAAAADALARMRSESVALAGAWSGAGATEAAESLLRQCDRAADVLDGVRESARACDMLADALWQVVDDRVGRTVTTAERVRGADEPHEPADALGREWLSAMTELDARSAAAFREANQAIAAGMPVRFESVGDFVTPTPSAAQPTPSAAQPTPSAAQPTPAASATVSAAVPAAPVAPGPAASVSAAPATASEPLPLEALGPLPEVWESMVPAAPLPEAVTPMPATVPNTAVGAPNPSPWPAASSPPAVAPSPALPPPDLGSGLSGTSGAAPPGLPNLAGLLRRADKPDPVEEPGALDAPEPTADDQPVAGPDEDADGDPPEEEPTASAPGESEQDAPAAASGAGEPAPAPPCQQAPTPTAVAPAPPGPPAPEVPVSEAPQPGPERPETPCEIAADELPQVGE